VQSIVGTQATIGAWRPTPQGLPNQLPGASGAGPQFATMTPWVLTRPSQFRFPPPPALETQQYAADLDEVFKMGVYSGSGRTQDQSDLALFWAGNTPLYWNRIASQISVWNAVCHSPKMHTCSPC